MDRLAMLRQMAAAKPQDPFPSYGLAMELTKQGALPEARQTFESLVQTHPDYVPSYLMFGNLLVKMGERDDASSVFARGIEVANQAGDDHAASELQAAAAELS